MGVRVTVRVSITGVRVRVGVLVRVGVTVRVGVAVEVAVTVGDVAGTVGVTVGSA